VHFIDLIREGEGMEAEAVVAERLGVSREDLLRMRRKMARGKAWEVVPDSGVVFTDEGIAELERMVGVGIPKKKKEVPGPVAAVAAKTDYPNRQMILAMIGGELVRCRVRNADMYVPQMAFEAVKVQEPDLFEETRSPRFKGRV
jgi:hypothetical protein